MPSKMERLARKQPRKRRVRYEPATDVPVDLQLGSRPYGTPLQHAIPYHCWYITVTLPPGLDAAKG